MGVDVDPCKKKKQKEREKKKVHIAGGGRERADGLCGSGVVRVCGWACRRVGTWMRMAVNKKKRRTKPEGSSVWMGLWVCGRADGCAAVWACRCGWL